MSLETACFFKPASIRQDTLVPSTCDIELIFSRIDDRLFDIDKRIKRIRKNYKDLAEDLAALRAEIEDVARDKDVLEDELRSLDTIQNDVLVDLEEQIRLNGLYIDDRWRVQSNGGNNGLLFSDILDGGAYLFRSLSKNLDVATVF